MKYQEGGDYAIWQFNHGVNKECLAEATIYSCDKCGKPTAVNAVWITGRAPHSYISVAHDMKKEYGEIEEACGTEDGDSLCQNCYVQHMKSEVE